MTTEGVAARFDARSVNRLLVRAGRHGGAWVVVLAVNVAVLTVAESALPAVLGRTIDGALGRAAADHWLLWSSLLIGVLVACDVADELGTASATARSTAWLRRITLGHLLSVRLRSLDRFSPGDLVSRLVGNTEDAGAVGSNIVEAVTSVVLAAAGVVALAIIDPWLCVTFLAGMPVLLLMLWAFAKDASELSERYLAAQGLIASRLVGALRGARTIAASGTTAVETRRVLAPLEDLHRHGKGMWRAQTRIPPTGGGSLTELSWTGRTGSNALGQEDLEFPCFIGDSRTAPNVYESARRAMTELVIGRSNGGRTRPAVQGLGIRGTRHRRDLHKTLSVIPSTLGYFSNRAGPSSDRSALKGGGYLGHEPPKAVGRRRREADS